MIPLRDDNPSERRPLVTIGLLVAVTLVFLWQLSLGPRAGEAMVYTLGLIPGSLVGQHELPPELALVPPMVTVFTSMFLHGGWMHLLGNMLYLWIFGDNVEDAMGRARFLLFYLLCGVAAALAQALPDPHSTIPMIGASGAISGVLGAYLLLFPRARVLVLIPIGFLLYTVRWPASLVLIGWFLLQLVSNAFSTDGAGVAFRAHLGGFAAGMALVFFFKRSHVHLFNPLRP
ncbi:MAG: rhomboid family intramembrane serine protease [Pseudomonadales bacterium]